MILLKEVHIHKYRNIQEDQVIPIDENITTLVGMNESGKTSVLTCLAKTNHFDKDPDFTFDSIHDYPRGEYVAYRKKGEPCPIITCTFATKDELLKEIENDVGQGVFSLREFSVTTEYETYDINHWQGDFGDTSKFLINLTEEKRLTLETVEKIQACRSLAEVLEIQIQSQSEEADLDLIKARIEKMISESFDTDWRGELGAYIACKWLSPQLPKFLYFDEYYPLPGEINITDLDRKPNDEREKTAIALFEMAAIKPSDIISDSGSHYEEFIAVLEEFSNTVTAEISKYWKTNPHLNIEFKIKENNDRQGKPQKILDIRVKDQRHKISLPLDRRSKGFNWFFSFIVWFSKIQSDEKSNYILLLDEPALNLHASAQADLLKFIEELSKKYQIIYTTHSPFMIDPKKLQRVRTCIDTPTGTKISESIQEKDPNTIFPLQAALGYDIAQNLFVSNNNLLVEGPADLIYLTAISSYLEGVGRRHLKPEITIVPVGGLDKVSTFISLLRGSKLKVACLLDTFQDQRGKKKIDDLIADKIIKKSHVRFFDEFSASNLSSSDIEDLFEPAEYLNLFNIAFKNEHPTLELANLTLSNTPILKQISKAISRDRFNHYRPANILNSTAITETTFSAATLARFEKLFIEINKLYFPDQN